MYLYVWNLKGALDVQCLVLSIYHFLYIVDAAA